jgi:hypothetical protein
MPHFIIVQGGLGQGKTLNACVLAHYWKAATGGRAKIFANFEMRGATLFDHYTKWYDVADALGSIIIWDEAQLQFDRRQWARNTIESQIFNMTRKLRAVHIFVTPVGNTLDSRILDLCEVLVNVRKREGVGIWLDFYEYQDKRFGQWGRHISTKFLKWSAVKKIFKLQLYDTYQMVYPFQVPHTERQQVEFLRELQERHRLALERERKGITIQEDEKDGWYTTSDYAAEKARSEGVTVPLSEHELSEV